MSTQLFDIAPAAPTQSTWAKEDQPAYKILLKGRTALTDAETVSLLIDGSHPLNVAREMLQRYGNDLNKIAAASITELMTIKGVGQATATRIMASFEIGRRRPEPAYRGKISRSNDAADLLRPLIGEQPHEFFYIILLDKGNRVINTVRISEGGMSGTVVDPKRIFKIALDNHAHCMILGHNHPSGQTTPSEADKKITARLKDGGIMLEIAVLDHIIIGHGDHYLSFADEGIM